MVAETSKLANFPVSLPKIPIPKGTDPQGVARTFEDVLSSITNAELYAKDAVWRDTFALTGTLRTFYSPKHITEAWKGASATSATPVLGSFQIIPPASQLMQVPDGSSWVEISGGFKINTKHGLTGQCALLLGVVPDGVGWKIWSMRTVLEDIEGWPSVNHYEPQPPQSALKTIAYAEISKFDVAIVGGGHSGLGVAGRLQALGVDYVLFDRYDKVGDSWATRYDTVKLHTPREYAHLPFERTFTQDQYGEWLSKDELAHGHRDWANKYGINDHIWPKCELISGSWEDKTREWTLKLYRHGKEQIIKCRFLVMATGSAGREGYMPSLPKRELFTGKVLHSQTYISAKDWKGQKGVIIGAANTAHDIADDMYEAGMSSVTMIQRSHTYVVPRENWKTMSDPLYNSQIPTDLADKLQLTGPAAVGRLIVKSGLDALADQQKERFDALARAGFLTESHGDMIWHLLERAGGHYLDTGTSQKIADGKIKVKSNVSAVEYAPEGLRLSNGQVVPADVILWATGFESNMRDNVRRLLGGEVADSIEDYLSLDDEGETGGGFKLEHPGLIMHGVALGQARFFSKYVALQIKASLCGQPFVAYTRSSRGISA